MHLDAQREGQLNLFSIVPSLPDTHTNFNFDKPRVKGDFIYVPTKQQQNINFKKF